MDSYELEEADVVVIGAGSAGLWAAIRARDFAKRVLLLEKGVVCRSGVSVFCHVYMSPLDDVLAEQAMLDMIERSTYLADQSWMKVLVADNNARIADLERWGIVFEKDGAGLRTEKGSRGWRVKARALTNGQRLMAVLKKVALDRGVEFRERFMATDLLTSDGRHPTRGHVVGVVGLDTRTGTWRVIRTKAVVVSTGLVSAKLHQGYADNVSGDGLAMAFRAGAELTCMELSPSHNFSFWNRSLYSGGQAQFQIDGARLVNRAGEEFLGKYQGASKEFVGFELQPDFGDLCRAIAIEILEGRGPVYFDLRSWDERKINRMRRVLPFTMDAFDQAGIDISKELVETSPVVGVYCASNQAGLKINTEAQTAVAGLYAAGAAAMAGKGVICQSFCFVAGYRAGENAGKRAQAMDFAALAQEQVEALRGVALAPLERRSGPDPKQIYYLVNRLVTPFGAGLFKEQERIVTTIEKIRKVAREDLPEVGAADPHELVQANEARNFLPLIESVYLSALERKESRLDHYREDHPYRDDGNWLKWIICQSNGAGGIELKSIPVPLPYRSPPAPTLIPSPIQYRIAG